MLNSEIPDITVNCPTSSYFYCYYFGFIVFVMHLQISAFKTEKWTRKQTPTSD